MIDKIAVTVATDLNHTYESASDIIGREGEGNVSQLKITIPDKLSDYAVYIDFKKPNGEKIRTPQLKVESGVATYDVPLYLLSDSGELKVQLVFQKHNGTIWKSSKKRYFIQKSINALDDVPEGEREDFMSEAQKLIDLLSGEVSEIAEMLANDPDFVDNVISKMEIPTYVKTIDGRTLKFFFGTQAQYNSLSADEIANLFAIITDDTTKEELFSRLDDLTAQNANLATEIENLKNDAEWQPPLPNALGGQLNHAGYHIITAHDKANNGEPLFAPFCFGIVYWDGKSETNCPVCYDPNGNAIHLVIGADGVLQVYFYQYGSQLGVPWACTFDINRLGVI